MYICIYVYMYVFITLNHSDPTLTAITALRTSNRLLYHLRTPEHRPLTLTNEL